MCSAKLFMGKSVMTAPPPGSLPPRSFCTWGRCHDSPNLVPFPVVGIKRIVLDKIQTEMSELKYFISNLKQRTKTKCAQTGKRKRFVLAIVKCITLEAARSRVFALQIDSSFTLIFICRFQLQDYLTWNYLYFYISL